MRLPFWQALLQQTNGSGIFHAMYIFGGAGGSFPLEMRFAFSFSHSLHSSRHNFNEIYDAEVGTLTVTQLLTNVEAHITQKFVPR